MKIVDQGGRRRKWPGRGLLLLFAGLVAAAGFGLFNCGFLQRVRHDPKGMLWDTTRNYLHARLHAPELDEIHIHMKFADYEKILAKREEALRIGLLFTGKGDEVPATLEADGKKLPVKMRLKGDWPDHFQTDKWSFRIQTRKGSQFRGMRRFSVQDPGTRRYLGEWLFLRSMRREGILAPRYDFLKLSFNGDPKGIFAIEEHFGKELLESQERTEGPIAKFDEDPYWEQRERSHNEFHLGWLDLDHLDYQTAAVTFFREGKMREDPLLRGEMAAARHLLEGFQRGSLSASQVFDVGQMARFIALCRVWGADHALIWHNLRFYYNPNTARLEPIAFDGEPWGWTREDMARSDVIDGYEFSLGVGGWFPWMREFLEDPGALAEYMKDLWRYSDPAWSDSLRTEFGEDLEKRLLALRLEWPRLEGPIAALQSGQDFFRGKLQPEVAFSGEYSAAGDSLQLKLTPICDVPVEIVAVRSGSQLWKPPLPFFLPSHRKLDPLRPQMLRVPLPLPENGAEVKAVYRTFALEATRHERTLRPVPPAFPDAAILPPPPSDAAAFARTRKWLRWNEQQRVLTVIAGEWHLKEDLILPRVPTRVEAGTVLHMDPGVLILARDRLDFEGSAKKPIRLLPASGSWGALFLLQADSLSRWNELEVRGTAGLDRPGWLVTGGVSVYDSPVEISHCRFEGHRGEDGVHLMHSRVLVEHTIIGSCASDALDGDFIEGRLNDCSFHDVGGDAVDLSGSTIDATQLQALRVSDKAISAGEKTRLRLTRFRVEKASIGIASKDLSSVIAQDGVMRGVNIGLAAYTKKPVYGPAKLLATHIDFGMAEPRTIAQTGSLIRLNGENLPTSDFDVKKLYASGVLGN